MLAVADSTTLMLTGVTLKDLDTFCVEICIRTFEVRGDRSHHLDVFKACVVLGQTALGIRCRFPTEQILVIKSQPKSTTERLIVICG